ncbi:hypothetical protein BpHYR1_009263 [Brachionus plicatilis]|uniref:Transmembrane protein n=1 Tax=Brachionus plicatilis TaxID=10195 RepID=A0A3M7Q6X6_BRAPC|nr:hypothetical protein BpHYR1_009263 [Brachionus plicatilis]
MTTVNDQINKIYFYLNFRIKWKNIKNKFKNLIFDTIILLIFCYYMKKYWIIFGKILLSKKERPKNKNLIDNVKSQILSLLGSELSQLQKNYSILEIPFLQIKFAFLLFGLSTQPRISHPAAPEYRLIQQLRI